MKSVSFSIVENQLNKKEYSLPMVEVIGQYPVKDDHKTFEYQFKRQNPSKISIPVGLLDKIQWKQDDDGHFYMVLDGTVVERTVENGFKRVQLVERYRPAEATKGSVE